MQYNKVGSNSGISGFRVWPIGYHKWGLASGYKEVGSASGYKEVGLTSGLSGVGAWPVGYYKVGSGLWDIWS